MSDQIERVRRFNRTVTQRLGVLEDRFLAQDRPLGQARVLWEIGRAGGIEVRDLRTLLDLDSGQLSRVLRALESQGLVITRPDDGDARVRTARLTPAGDAEYVELDRRSDAAAAGLLDPLSAAQRDRLVTAMGEVERLMLASQVRIAEADPSGPAARFAAREYYAELATRLEEGFDPTVGGVVGEASITPPRGLLLVATLGTETVGCGAITFHDNDTAEIKRVWAAPSVRGLGLGRRLVAELEARAAATGATSMKLDTNRSLTEAIALYRRLGYVEVPAYNENPYAHHWFAKSLPAAE